MDLQRSAQKTAKGCTYAPSKKLIVGEVLQRSGKKLAVDSTKTYIHCWIIYLAEVNTA